MAEELKPMDVGRILDKTFKMTFSNFKKNIKLFIIIIGIFTGVTIIFSLIGGGFYIFNRDLFENLSEPRSYIPLLSICIPFISIYVIILLIVSLFYNGMLFDIFIKSFLGDEWKMKESFGLIRQKFGIILISGILCFFIMIGGILMCFIGVIPMSVFICLTLPAILFEKKGITDSISRSFKLVSYSFWPVLGYSLLFNIIISVAANIFQYVFVGFFTLISVIYNNDYNNMNFMILLIVLAVIFLIFYLVLSLIIYALNSAFYILIFFNQKIKYENFGVEVMTTSIIENNAGSEIN